MLIPIMKYKLHILIILLMSGSFFPANNIYASKILTDQLGRQVSLPDNPIRVVSLAPSITEIVFALGQEDRLIGATRFSDFPEAAKKLPKVGSYVHLDLEKIVSLKPDLCLHCDQGR